MIPQDEAGSTVWTDEMAAACGVARHLLAEGDRIGARMAFKEAYSRLVAQARDDGKPVRWSPSLGHDPGGREAVLQEAVRLGRLSIAHAAVELLPGIEDRRPALLAGQERVAALIGGLATKTVA